MALIRSIFSINSIIPIFIIVSASNFFPFPKLHWCFSFNHDLAYWYIAFHLLSLPIIATSKTSLYWKKAPLGAISLILVAGYISPIITAKRTLDNKRNSEQSVTFLYLYGTEKISAKEIIRLKPNIIGAIGHSLNLAKLYKEYPYHFTSETPNKTLSLFSIFPITSERSSVGDDVPPILKAKVTLPAKTIKVLLLSAPSPFSAKGNYLSKIYLKRIAVFERSSPSDIIAGFFYSTIHSWNYRQFLDGGIHCDARAFSDFLRSLLLSAYAPGIPYNHVAVNCKAEIRKMQIEKLPGGILYYTSFSF